MSETKLGGRFTFPGTSLTVHRMGYGAMQLAGPGVWGPPRDPDGAVAVLREAVAAGVDHIDTADFYGPHVTNQIIRKALHPYPENLVIVTKLGAVRGEDASWKPAHSKDDAFIDDLAQQGIPYVPFFPLGGFTPIPSSTLSDVAGRLGSTPMQVALAWLLHRSPNILLIPGTSSRGHLRENLAAAELTLPADAVADLDGIAAAKS